MAFVRWRGNCAQLLATLSVQGHSRQICLANLEGRYAVPDWIRMRVQDEHPAIRVDWERIDRALAAVYGQIERDSLAIAFPQFGH